MRKILSGLLILVTLLSCTDQDDTITAPVIPDTSRDLVFLKVDYQTNAFLGGTEYHFEDVLMTETIPFEETFVPPSDFGSYFSLNYSPTDTTVFNGPIIWMGGDYNYPVENASNHYSTTTNNAIVNLSTAEYFTPTANDLAAEGHNTDFDYQSIWNAVKNLEITNNYTNNNAKVGFLLYTPGLGLFNPDNACWFVILYK